MNTLSFYGQGIHFSSSLEEAQKQAAKGSKNIFVDVYTQWCGPCKKMSSKVFPLKEVGDYYNKHFISIKVDAETPEGKVIADKYGIKGYPTLLFLDPEGSLLHITSGARDAKGLLELGKNCSNPLVIEANKMTKEFEAGKLDHKGLKVYMQTLKKAGLPVTTAMKAWIESLPEKEHYSAETVKEICKVRFKAGEYPFDYLLENYDEFVKVMDQNEFDTYLFVGCIFKSYENRRARVDNEIYWQTLSKTGVYFVPALRESYDIVEKVLRDPKRKAEAIKRTRNIANAYPVCAAEIGLELTKYAYGNNKDLMDFAKELLDIASTHNKRRAATIASSYVSILLFNAKDYQTANYWVDKYIEWSGDPDFSKDKTLIVKRALGMAKCKNYGKVMPDFKLKDIKGGTASLSDYRGKYVLLDFWASWCGPCKKEIPYLKDIDKKYASKGLVIIGVSSDKDLKEWHQTVTNEGMTWIQVNAHNSDTYKKYGIMGIPRIMLLDPEGKLIADDLRGTLIDNFLQRIIQ